MDCQTDEMSLGSFCGGAELHGVARDSTTLQGETDGRDSTVLQSRSNGRDSTVLPPGLVGQYGQFQSEQILR